MRFDLMRCEDLAQPALRQLGQAAVPRGRAVLANGLGKQPRRPQFVRRAKVLGLAASQIDNEGPRPGRGLSSSAAMTPSLSTRRRQRSTV